MNELLTDIARKHLDVEVENVSFRTGQNRDGETIFWVDVLLRDPDQELTVTQMQRLTDAVWDALKDEDGVPVISFVSPEDSPLAAAE
ncbi:MAG: hypothetical protein AAGA70_03320 [Pseudomonadota bacterium]